MKFELIYKERKLQIEYDLNDKFLKVDNIWISPTLSVKMFNCQNASYWIEPFIYSFILFLFVSFHHVNGLKAHSEMKGIIAMRLFNPYTCMISTWLIWLHEAHFQCGRKYQWHIVAMCLFRNKVRHGKLWNKELKNMQIYGYL